VNELHDIYRLKPSKIWASMRYYYQKATISVKVEDKPKPSVYDDSEPLPEFEYPFSLILCL